MMETELNVPTLAKCTNTHEYHPFQMADRINNLLYCSFSTGPMKVPALYLKCVLSLGNFMWLVSVQHSLDNENS